jgi:putative hydrolase of the HAD superfamily
MIKAILFDFDGVLTLDETGSLSICNYVSATTGIDKDIFTKAYRKYNSDLLTGKHAHEEVWGSICDAVGHQINIKILYDSFINTPINYDMLKLVLKLKEIGYKIGMVTDNKTDRIKSIVNHHQVDDIFDAIVVSAEVGSGKDQEQIFLAVFQKLSVTPDECIFIDNKEENLVIPKNFGVTTIFHNHTKNDVSGLEAKLSTLVRELS